MKSASTAHKEAECPNCKEEMGKPLMTLKSTGSLPSQNYYFCQNCENMWKRVGTGQLTKINVLEVVCRGLSDFCLMLGRALKDETKQIKFDQQAIKFHALAELAERVGR